MLDFLGEKSIWRPNKVDILIAQSIDLGKKRPTNCSVQQFRCQNGDCVKDDYRFVFIAISIVT